MGRGEFARVPLRRIARAVHDVVLPRAEGAALEYYIEAVTADGAALRWPAAAPDINQTVVVMPAARN
jgi:hypothetical protein